MTTKAKQPRSLLTILRSLKNEWNAIFAAFGNLYVCEPLQSQEKEVYLIKCNVRSRKTTAKSNIKSALTTLHNIECLLIECSESIKVNSDIDTVFKNLCFISREIVAFDNMIAKLNTLCGSIYQANPAISDIENKVFAHYVSLLKENVRNELATKKKLTDDSETLAQQHEKVATDIEKQRTSIVRAVAELQESIQRQEEIQVSCQKQQLLIDRDIAELTEALEQLNDGIVTLEGSMDTCEEDFANATAQKNGLFSQVQSSQRDIEQFVAQSQLKTATLHEQIANTETDVQNTLLTLKARSQHVDDLRASLAKHQEDTATLYEQIAEAEAVVQKTIFFKKAKIQRVEDLRASMAKHQIDTATLHEQIAEAETDVQNTLASKNAAIQRIDKLRASLGKHQEECASQIAHLEEKLASLKMAHDAQASQTAKIAATLAEKREKLAQYIHEKATLLQRIEAKKADQQQLEGKITEGAAVVVKKQEALQKKEKELGVLLSKLDDCAKALEHNQRKVTTLDSQIVEKIIVYPTNFARVEAHITVHNAFDYAFAQQFSDVFNTANEASVQIRMFDNQRLHMQALQQALVELVEGGAISPDTCALSIGSKLKDIEERIQQLEIDTTACRAAFDIDGDNTNERPYNTLVKKIRKLFDAYWTLMTEGALVPQGLQPVLDGARSLQVSADYFLYFTPFYIVALEHKKRSRVVMELVEYTAISLEAVESQISLGYGQECPEGATIIRERWKYETVNGAPNRRYTNNQSYYVVALNGVKLLINGREKITYYKSAEEAEKTLQAFDDFRNFLYNENADVMEAIFDCSQIPDVIRITTEIAESRKKEESTRKEQERQLKQQEIRLKKQREEEKRQREIHQKRLEQWADNAQKKKAEDDLLVKQRQDLLAPITAVELANCDELQSMPVSISDKRRVITTGITKVEFVQQENAVGTKKYLVLFTDETGKEFSDVRTLACSPVGTTSVIPFEIKTQSIVNPTILYLLVRDMDNGKLVGKFEYKMNIAFTNDFDFCF